MGEPGDGEEMGRVTGPGLVRRNSYREDGAFRVEAVDEGENEGDVSTGGTGEVGFGE